MAQTNNDTLTLYEAIALKKTSLPTIKAAIKNGQLKVERLAPVGKSRKIEMIRKDDLHNWTPSSDSSIQRAATILGISFDEAKRLKDANRAK
jgi:hypothetical protein